LQKVYATIAVELESEAKPISIINEAMLADKHVLAYSELTQWWAAMQV
jgi:hypothetical protein